MAVAYENLIIVGGRFNHDGGDIETVTVSANSTLARGSLLGTDGTKYLLSDDAATDGSEVPTSILNEDVVNDTGSDADYKVVVLKKGTFNSQGVTFGGAHTVDSTKEALHKVSIEITNGVA